MKGQLIGKGKFTRFPSASPLNFFFSRDSLSRGANRTGDYSLDDVFRIRTLKQILLRLSNWPKRFGKRCAARYSFPAGVSKVFVNLIVVIDYPKVIRLIAGASNSG